MRFLCFSSLFGFPFRGSRIIDKADLKIAPFLWCIAHANAQGVQEGKHKQSCAWINVRILKIVPILHPVS